MHERSSTSARSPVFAAILLASAAACATATRSAPAPLSLSSLSLDEKIGQLFVYASTGRFMNEESPEYRELLHQVRDNHVGGVMWFLSSGVYETAFLNRKLQAAARTPLLVAADLEAGIGMRFQDTTYWPWPMAIAATGDPALAESEGRIVAEEARALGLNQIYAPVADVNVNPRNPAINVRSFGEDPREVGRFVAAFVRGVQGGGVLATVKHFPGHGGTPSDSHRSLPVLERTSAELDAVELVPFRAAIEAGVGSVMTAHLSVPSLDPSPAPPRPGGALENPYTRDVVEVTANATVPASLSELITGGLLRRRLGFRGLVVTDAVDMGGIVDHFDAGEAAVRAILAGADQVLKSPDVGAAVAGVRRAVESGRIPLAAVDAAVARVLAAKARFPAADADPERIFRVVDRPDHRAVAEEIARRSLTLVRRDPAAWPIHRESRVAHVVVTDQPRLSEDLTGELRRRLSHPPAAFLLDPLSTAADVETTLAGAAQSETVLISIFARFQSGRGSIGIPDGARAAVERILAGPVPTVVVVFGSPYLLSDFPGVRSALVAWGSQAEAQSAAARAVFGEAAVGGRLPVTIPGIADRGAGIPVEAAPR
ncbi:MAG: glycoside hydrolase family 3 N-terminal domain-containing protein [Acidobacteriota bacterium]